MLKQKWRNRTLERGVVVDKARGYVFLRYKIRGTVRKQLIGKVSDPNIVDIANAKARYMREERRLGKLNIEKPKEHLLFEDACNLYFNLHGLNRDSPKGVKQFVRNLGYLKQAWAGRYVDTITYLDVEAYRKARAKQRRHEQKCKRDRSCACLNFVMQSTINREHTVITSLFNELKRWRKIGKLPKHIALPEDNPGELVKKADELHYVRDRLLSKEEFESLYTFADAKMRRIIIAELNAPLRLQDLKHLTKNRINGKLNEFKGIQTKTGQEYYIPITGPMWELIKTAPGEAILDFTGFAGRWKRLIKRVGAQTLQFRDLRRTAATALHDGGHPLKVVSRMLGHASVATTERYLGLRTENLQAAGKTLGELFRAPAVTPNGIQSVPKSVPQPAEFRSSDLQNRIDL